MKRFGIVLMMALTANGMFTDVVKAGSLFFQQIPNGGGSDMGPSNLAGTVTNDISIYAGPTEQIVAIQIYANITDSREFFQHPFGGNTPPNSAFFSFFPNLAFDTFVASGAATNTLFVPIITGASTTLGSPGSGGPAIFNNKTLDVSFQPQAGQNTQFASQFLALRFTGNEASGTFKMDVQFSGNGPHASVSTVFFNGRFTPPEPTSFTLASVVVFGLVGSVRRRS